MPDSLRPARIAAVVDDCVKCGLCLEDALAFLDAHGDPLNIGYRPHLDAGLRERGTDIVVKHPLALLARQLIA